MWRDLRQIGAFFGGLLLVAGALSLCSSCSGSSSQQDRAGEQIASQGLHEVCRVLHELESADAGDGGRD